MTAKSIMSFRLVKLKPTDKVCDSLQVMHAQQTRELPRTCRKWLAVRCYLSSE